MKVMSFVVVCGLAVASLTPLLAGNREDCLQDADPALATKACPLYERELTAKKRTETASPTSSAAEAAAKGFFNQDWQLNPAKSSLSMTTVKKRTVTETHVFGGIDGNITPDGAAELTIDLGTLETNIDIRNVRMRFLLFETFKYPNAVITAQLDKAVLQDLVAGKSVSYQQDFTVDLHGVTKPIVTQITVTRSADNVVLVTSAGSLIITADDFDLGEGVARLRDAADNIEIVPSAKITFDLAFEAATGNPQLKAARDAASSLQAQQKSSSLSAEECQTRMDVISKTRQIYFKSGSARIDAKESAPLLDEVAQFSNRCPTVAMEISGHTDTDGGEAYNQKLSEQRARAVADALVARGLENFRLTTVGYGFSKPVADNATTAGKAQNRRIEFHRADDK